MQGDIKTDEKKIDGSPSVESKIQKNEAVCPADFEKEEETPRDKDLQNLVEDLKDYKATRMLEEKIKNRNECPEESSSSSSVSLVYDGIINQIEGLEENFTEPNEIGELDCDAPLEEEIYPRLLEQMHVDPRGPGFDNQAELNVGEQENGIDEPQPEESSFYIRTTLYKAIVFLLLAAVISLSLLLTLPRSHETLQKREIEIRSAPESTELANLYPNKSPVKIFRDTQNGIFWNDREDLVPVEMKKQIQFALQRTGEEKSNGLFDCISSWKFIKENQYDSQLPPKRLSAEAKPFLKKLILPMSEHVNVNRRDGKDNGTPLMLAAIYDEGEAVKKLIERNARLEDVDDYRYTALHLAAERGSSSACKILLQNGANFNALTEYKWTPLMYAESKNNVEIIDLLRKYNAQN